MRASISIALLLGLGCSNNAEELYLDGEKSLAAGDPVVAELAFGYAHDLDPGRYKYLKAIWRTHAVRIARDRELVTVDNARRYRFELAHLQREPIDQGVLLLASSHVAERLGSLDEAMARLGEMLKLDPKDPRAHLARAELLMRTTRDVDQAITEYRAVLAVDKDSFEAHLGLGRLYVMKQDSAQEVSELLAATQKNGQSYEAVEALGDACLHAGRLDEAIDSYRRAARLRPAEPEPHWGLGLALSRKEKWAEAEREIRIGMVGKHTPQMDLQLGLALARLKRCPEALAALQSYLRDNPESAPALVEMGACEVTLGRDDAAIQYWRRILAQPLPDDAALRAAVEVRNRTIEARIKELDGAKAGGSRSHAVAARLAHPAP
jgi:tetratricopeptide (TPR) repeat protein